jgi:hypothetical protein
MKKQRRKATKPVEVAAQQLELVRGGNVIPRTSRWYVPELDSSIDDFVDARY